MKLLLTSGGVTNPTIQSSLVELLGKPVAECRAFASRRHSGATQRGPASGASFIVGVPGSSATWGGRQSAFSS